MVVRMCLIWEVWDGKAGMGGLGGSPLRQPFEQQTLTHPYPSHDERRIPSFPDGNPCRFGGLRVQRQVRLRQGRGLLWVSWIG